MAQENTYSDIHLETSEPEIRKIGERDLWQALKKGLEDFNAHPSFVVFLFVVYPLFALLVSLFVIGEDLLHLAFPIVAGFTLPHEEWEELIDLHHSLRLTHVPVVPVADSLSDEADIEALALSIDHAVAQARSAPPEEDGPVIH